jgi:phage terminase large subunit-like protein
MGRVSPRFQRPEHFAGYARRLESAIGGGLRVVFSAPPQHGKELRNDTPIETRRGWVTVGDVEVGDQLVGSDGRWTRVTAVYPQPVGPMYQVTFGDGSSLVAGGPHRWATRGKHCKRWKIRTTEEMFGRERVDGTSHLQGKLYPGTRSRWEIPVMSGLEREPEDLRIDPYLLGCWLGDGTTAAASITSADPEIISAFDERYERGKTDTAAGLARTVSYLGLRSDLRDLGVLGDKHIPSCYLRGSQSQRLALLQGLCDTDGTVAKNGSQQTYTTTRDALLDGFRQLVFSLGGHCTCYSRPAAYKTAHTIAFRLPGNLRAFRLDRKLRLLRPPSGRNSPRKRIASIERVSDASGTCFTVDAVDSLFCAGREYIVSHNSETTYHGLAHAAVKYPHLRHALVTYSDRRAQSAARRVRRILADCEVVVGGTLQCLTLPQGGQILFTSIDGGITGEPVDGLAIIDDYIKNRREADSQSRRKIIEDCYREAIAPRVHPGASVLVLATRWHPDDLSGILIAEGWESINLPAIAEENDPNGRAVGDALFPDMWPVSELQKQHIHVTDFTWQALYQGHPRPRGGKIFHEPTWYTRLPTNYRPMYGVDLAYTAKTSADWSVCVALYKEDRLGEDPLYYVVHVDRAQVEAPDFAMTLRARQEQRPGIKMHWRASGTEKGAAQFLLKSRLPIIVKRPPGDKLVSATPVAAAWNSGRVLVPDPEAFPAEADSWLYPFLDIVSNFTGTGKEHDDDVDALGNAFDELERPRSVMLAGQQPCGLM